MQSESCTYNFGARYYNSDASILMSVDPLAEKYPNISPYAYCANNLILFKDPDGREIWIYYQDKKGNDIKGALAFASSESGGGQTKRNQCLVNYTL